MTSDDSVLCVAPYWNISEWSSDSNLGNQACLNERREVVMKKCFAFLQTTTQTADQFSVDANESQMET